MEQQTSKVGKTGKEKLSLCPFMNIDAKPVATFSKCFVD
jgi:hypothetical protein